LILIFGIQGAPMILQSDNGREFVAEVIVKVMSLWPDVVIVHGRPRHPQSQGSVERANQDVESMLGNWMNDNKSKNWVLGLHFVQLAKNTRNHSGVGNPPYTLQYGQTCRYGVSSLPIDKALLSKLQTEDDLMEVMNSISFVTEDSMPHEADHIQAEAEANPIEGTEVFEATVAEAAAVNPIQAIEAEPAAAVNPIQAIEAEPAAAVNPIQAVEAEAAAVDPIQAIEAEAAAIEFTEFTQKLDDVMDTDVSDLLCASPSLIENEESNQSEKENIPPRKYDTPGRGHLRTLASTTQQQQAKRMQKRVREDTIQDVPVGGICLVPIDKVDRSKVDPRRLPCVVVEVTPRIQYRLACKAGVLDRVLCRQDFLYEPNKTPVFYGLQDALQNWTVMKKVSVRAGSGAIAPSGGQGHLHCGCSGKCDSKRCGCLRAGQRCNSRCHPTNSKCCNKCL
jgi:hypothetical protein